MKYINKFLIVALSAGLLTACTEDYLSVKSTSSMPATEYQKKLEEDPSVFASTLAGTYTYFATEANNHDDAGLMAMLHAGDMMTEDIVQAKEHWFTYDYCLEFNQYNYRRPYSTWSQLYTPISQVNNDVINGIDVKKVMETPSSKVRPYLGEAFAIRAFCYMNLIQFFQNPFTTEPDNSGAAAHINREAYGVPIKFATSESELGKSSNDSRNTVGKVYEVIESDLKNAISLLDGAPIRETKMNINKQVAEGLLARFYLMAGRWEDAANYAKAARDGYTMLSKEELFAGFMDLELSDVMWGFKHNAETSMYYASFSSHISNLSPGYAGMDYAPRLIDKRLYEQIAKEDFRKKLFNDDKGDQTQEQPGAKLAYANLKFGWKSGFEQDYIYMRAAEMVLIEAEALARLGKLAEAKTVLKELLDKRYEQPWNGEVSVDEILLQRRIELWGEGFGLFDLKRLHRGIDRTYEGTNHRKPAGLLVVPAGHSRWTYQIPEREMQENTEINDEHQNR